MEEDEEVDRVIMKMKSYDRDSKDHLDDLDLYSDEEGEEEPEFMYDSAEDDMWVGLVEDLAEKLYF